MKLTRNIAARIQGETGINVDALLAGRLRNEFGGKYTAEFYSRWKDREFRQNEEIAIDNARRLAWWIEVLLRASVVGSRRRLWPVWHSIVETVRACYSDFDLGRPVDEILSKCKPAVKWNPGGRTPDEIAVIEEEVAREENCESDYQTHREKVMAGLTQKKRSSSRRRCRRA